MKKALIVGCGLTGASIARILADNGYNVTIFERRNHICGNLYDYYDEHDILIHKYGPHTFHTDNPVLVTFINKYAKWVEAPLKCGAVIDGICTPTPFNFKTVDTFFPNEAELIKKEFLSTFGTSKTVSIVEALESDNAYVKRFADFLFEKDYRPYTSKQWGVEPTEIDKSVLKRVPLRLSYDEGYFDDKYQLVPQDSYLSFFEKLLGHKNISIQTNIDALSLIKISEKGCFYKDNLFENPIVFTGPIDELFHSKFGKLPYRSLRFDLHYEKIDSKQDFGVVAYPQAKEYTRVVEFKKITGQKSCGTTYEIEFPLPYMQGRPQEPYYPLLTSDSMCLYKKYQNLLKLYPNLFVCGRLGDYKYYNMDQALEKAIETAEKILKLFGDSKK